MIEVPDFEQSLARLADWYDANYDRLPVHVREWAIRVIGGTLAPETLHYQMLRLEGQQMVEASEMAMWREVRGIIYG